MSVLAPLWLAVAAIVAAGVVLAHLFSTNVPPREVLPTVRFVPERAPMAVLRTRRITDVGLLLMRVAAVALIGLALAGAHVPVRGPARIVLIDASRAVATPSVTATYAEHAGNGGTRGNIIIVFDSTGRVVEGGALDTLVPSQARGSLSAALVTAHRAVAGVSRGRDDIELRILSPLVREEVDSATAALVALWQGPVRFVRIPSATADTIPPSVQVRALPSDPVAAALDPIPTGGQRQGRGVRVIRTGPTGADSTFARGGGVVVHWPIATAAPAAERPRQPLDTAAAFASNHNTVVGTFARTHRPADGRVIARWSDGEPAATETAMGAGCIRDVAIPVDPVGDMALRESFRGFARELLDPCGGARDLSPVPDSLLLPRARPSFAGVTPVVNSRLPVILAVLALLVIAAEQLVRRRQGRGA